ncbi:MAG: hypothetical protein ACLQNE_19805 [Thermoguttaceae bacterium]|jgi:uncharacterized membrane protein
METGRDRTTAGHQDFGGRVEIDEKTSGPPIVPVVVCRKCRTTIGASDNYCRHCGTPTGSGPAGLAAWWESPWVVLPLLFLVAGPFALPLLWRSRRFTRPWKIALSVITVGLPLLVVWQAAQALNQALAPLLELDKLH